MKNVVKGVNNHGKGFEYSREKFPKLSDVKLKEDIFIGPQIREIINDDLFAHLLTETEKSAWLTLKADCLHFLGNVTAENYKQLVEQLLNAYQIMGCNMSLKIHCLHSNLGVFLPKLGAASDEHGEEFHQDISAMEKRCAGKWSQNMLADCYWNLAEQVSIASYQ